MLTPSQGRVEYKYLTPYAKSIELACLWDEMLPKDPYYQKQGGPYPVSSVYYDTQGYDFYHEKVEGEYFHRKARLRTYGNFPFRGPCFFEIKYKLHDDGYKKRVPMAAQHHAAGLLPLGWQMQLHDGATRQILGPQPLYPVCHVAYERRAYFLHCSSGEVVRLNIDSHMQLRFEAGRHDQADVLFPHSQAIIEVKAPSRGWWPELAAILTMISEPRTTFSKYISALNVLYSHNLMEGPP